jgi:phosphoglycolate phosphatase-like HAD superfamily hydrolase
MKLLLFDIDGTLLISQGLGRSAKALAMKEVFGTDAGVMTHPFGGKTDWQILNELLHPLGWTTDTIGEHMPRYQQVFAGHMQALSQHHVATALPGALELVCEMVARDDVLVGVVTGNTSETAPVKLRLGGFDPAWFKVGAYGNESHNRNDLPKLALQRAIAYTGQSISPRDVWVIGDTVADVECARALGANVVVVLTGFEDKALLLASQPDVVLEDLREFREKVSL